MFLFCGQVQAGFFIEAGAGLSSTATKVTALGGGETSSSGSGFDATGRLGYRFAKPFWIAAEYVSGSGKDDLDNATDYAKTSIGLLVGYDFGLYNVWLGYGPSEKLTFKFPGNPDLDFLGSSVKLGIGYEVRKWFSINVEYILPTYTKVSINGTESELSNFYSSFKSAGTLLSFSFPYEFGK